MPMRTRSLLLVLILVGCALRLVWPADMEWKTDERLVHAAAVEAATTGTMPAAGIKSGGGIVNPGLSLAPFAAVALFSSDPLDMVGMVQWANVIALLGFTVLAFTRFRGWEQRYWLVGLAIAAVNPMAILFSRKIWAQDLLPLLALLIMLGHLHRRKAWGALLWGVAGALIGQVHMSGFFLSLGLLVVTWSHDRAVRLPWRWPYWLLGSVLGGLPMIPWLGVLLNDPQASTTSFVNIFQLNFFFYWLLDPLGVDGPYALRDAFVDLLREPIVGGRATYLVGVAHALLLGVAFYSVKGTVALVKRTVERVRALPGWPSFFERMSTTDLYFWSILLGLGLGMPLAGVTIYQHYLICTFPFAYLYLARMIGDRGWVVWTALCAQLFISGCFIWFIHRDGGPPESDYGRSYRVKVLEAGR